MTLDDLQVEIEKLDVRDGDLFVITFPGSISADVAERIRAQWEHAFPNRKAVVFGDGGKVERIRMMRTMIAADIGVPDERQR